MQKLYEETVDNIMRAKTKDKLSDALWKTYYNLGAKCRKNCGKGLKILLLNAPCMGFGDLIFAIKLSNYLVEWYGAEVTLATTLEKSLLNLGANPKYVVGIIGASKRMQCRRFARLKLNKEIPEQDLILIAPMQIDFSPDLNDVKKMVPYANKWNTFSFSEYNDNLNKNFTFNTGVGGDRDGMLLTKATKTRKKPAGLKNPYAVVYVASTLDGVNKCIFSFVEMVAKKYYKKHMKLDIVIPPWFANNDIDILLKKNVSKFYPNISIVQKDKPPIVISKGGSKDNVLIFRCDVLPVPNNVMMQLMSSSINDILLTGDQSITDALSCCSNKNIFYQIAPWKSDLGKNLATTMPNIYLKKVSTSCGTLRAISYKSNYSKFVKKWDFRVRGRPKLDAIMLSILAMKQNTRISELADTVMKTKTLAGIKKNINHRIITKSNQTMSRSRSRLSRSRLSRSRLSRSRLSRSRLSRSRLSRSRLSRSRLRSIS
jgi:hypothetical protein